VRILFYDLYIPYRNGKNPRARFYADFLRLPEINFIDNKKGEQMLAFPLYYVIAIS